MRTYNIFKPDMVQDEKLIEEYLESVRTYIGLRPLEVYGIDDYNNICKVLYEMDTEGLNGEAKIIKRRQILTTIKAYEEFFANDRALATIFEFEGDEKEILSRFYTLKKELRKKYVYNSNKYFVKFLSDIDFSRPLTEIDTSNIQASYMLTSPDMRDPAGYNMAFFNKIHSPEPNIEEVKKEMKVLEEAEVFSYRKRVNRVWMN